ncbi:NGG1p interacting factor 3 protein, NIF3 [Desulfovibrionales bacterium]
MKLTSLLACIEQHAPMTGSSDWDRSGIQIAGRRTICHKLAACLDPLPNTMAATLDWGADLVLTHHPLVFAPRFLDQLDDYHHIISLFLKAEAWLYAAHTSLDVQINGPASWLAEDLELTDITILKTTGPNQGFGLVGNLPAPLPWQEFLHRIHTTVATPCLLHIGPTPATIKRVAYCIGAGGQFALTALAAGAQIYLTGDIKYHQALEAPLAILDVGHFALEEKMMQRFALHLTHDSAIAAANLEVKFFPGQDPRRLISHPTTGPYYLRPSQYAAIL